MALTDLGINTCYRYLEYFITLLIAIISGCFVVEMFMTAPPVTEVLEGFIPTIPDGSVYTGISLMVCARIFSFDTCQTAIHEHSGRVLESH
jgi:Mn2+/Fe2+ NRAMP family transporter